jgi:hypothetical protein
MYHLIHLAELFKKKKIWLNNHAFSYMKPKGIRLGHSSQQYNILFAHLTLIVPFVRSPNVYFFERRHGIFELSRRMGYRHVNNEYGLFKWFVLDRWVGLR